MDPPHSTTIQSIEMCTDNNWNSHFSRFPLIFHDILHNFQIPWYFHGWKSCHHFSRFSRCCGNPVYKLICSKQYGRLPSSKQNDYTHVPLSTISPSWSTSIWSACMIVESLCATIIVVRFSHTFASEDWIFLSVWVSNADVA